MRRTKWPISDKVHGNSYVSSSSSSFCSSSTVFWTGPQKFPGRLVRFLNYFSKIIHLGSMLGKALNSEMFSRNTLFADFEEKPWPRENSNLSFSRNRKGQIRKMFRRSDCRCVVSSSFHFFCPHFLARSVSSLIIDRSISPVTMKIWRL